MAKLKDWLYQIVTYVAWFHDRIIAKNRAHSSPFTDKELHFIIIGIFGFLLLLVVFPLFRYLTKHGRAGIMGWLFALSTVLSVCFAIEIGQQLTKTGRMQVEDIVYGMVGFFAASAIVALLYFLFIFFRWLFRKLFKK